MLRDRIARRRDFRGPGSSLQLTGLLFIVLQSNRPAILNRSAPLPYPSLRPHFSRILHILFCFAPARVYSTADLFARWRHRQRLDTTGSSPRTRTITTGTRFLL